MSQQQEAPLPVKRYFHRLLLLILVAAVVAFRRILLGTKAALSLEKHFERRKWHLMKDTNGTSLFSDENTEDALTRLSLPPLKDLIPTYHEEYTNSKSIYKKRYPRKRDRKKTRANLKQLRHDKDKLGDPKAIQQMLYFSVLGFPKCGTSTLQNWLDASPELTLHHKELWFSPSYPGELSRMIATLYHANAKRNTAFGKRGYKQPGQVYDMQSGYATMFRQHFPKTKLIVSIRHPVLWFESFYNYRKSEGRTMPTNLQTFLDNPSESHARLCLDSANFHVFLSMMGITTTTTTDATTNSSSSLQQRLDRNSTTFQDRHQMQLVRSHYKSKWKPFKIAYPPVPNPIFLMDVSQMDARQHNGTYYRQVANDLSKFLHLREPLQTRDWKGSRPQDHSNEKSSTSRLDVCNDQQDPALPELRRRLLEIGKAASEWILTYFVTQPQVTVSSPEFFRTALESWSQDPCNERRKTLRQ